MNILRLVTVNSGVLGIMVVYAVGVFIAYENPYVSLPSLPSYVLTPFSFALASESKSWSTGPSVN